jgi:choline dehydrogenase-like flavoprotein
VLPEPTADSMDLRAYPDEDLPEGAVVDGDALDRNVDEAYDFVVVGSGAAGAVAAHTLARAGYSVAILEEGPWVRTREFGPDVHGAFARMLRDFGLQTLKGRAYLPMIQGRCVGGSTVTNSAIAWRLPEDVVDDWRARFGLTNVSMAALESHFDALERELHVTPVADAVLGENNARFLAQCKAMGLEATPMRRYEKGCRGSGRCLTGCPNGAKQGMSVSYVPWTLAIGAAGSLRARIFTSCRCERVEIAGGRAVGALGKTARAAVRLRARRGVVVAASAVQTPNLLRRSGIRSRHLGEHFQAHPGVAVAAAMDRRVDMTFGATQGAECIQFRASDRFKLETLAMPPELAAARIPGVGAELADRMARFGDVAVWAVQVRAEAEGTVRPRFGREDLVRFTMTENDLRTTRKACALLARMLFGAGAREVWPGIFGVPPVLRAVDDVKLIEQGPLDPRAYSFIATHLFGPARMGPDPRTSVVGLDFACHEAEALYVVDSSVFPTNLGVNPQHTIMAMSRLAATQIAERATRQAVA